MHVVSLVVTDQHSAAVRPLTARSVVLSSLLGFHPPALPVSSLIRIGALFGVADRAIRTALTRMVADDDLVAQEGVYHLTQRLVERQQRQDMACSPQTRRWNGTWEVAIVTAPARPLANRVALRRTMAELRLAELREGAWTRPANLRHELPASVIEQCTVFDAKHADPEELVHRLWDLPAWADAARSLLVDLSATNGLREGFMISAAVIRHLLHDPFLPPALLPDNWPGADLRSSYLQYNAVYAARLREFSGA